MKKRFLGCWVVVWSLASLVYSQSANFFIDRNLFRPSKDINVTTVFTPSVPGNGSFTLYNSAGELIKSFYAGPLAANVPQTFVWDGKNSSGDKVSSGFYFFRFRVDLGTYTKKLLLIR